jgi:hypothetical protein
MSACAPAPLQDQLANGVADLQPFGRQQLHVEPFLLFGCKDLSIDDAKVIRALLGGVMDWIR